MVRLDRTRDFGTVLGDDNPRGVKYLQDGREFDADGQEVVLVAPPIMLTEVVPIKRAPRKPRK